jgi:hypothetical protein
MSFLDGLGRGVPHSEHAFKPEGTLTPQTAHLVCMIFWVATRARPARRLFGLTSSICSVLGRVGAMARRSAWKTA